MAQTHHTLDYVEIAAPDLPAAVDFYSRAFGWEFTHYGPEYAGIRSADGDGEVGGLTAQGVPGTGGPLVLLYSADLDATVAVRAGRRRDRRERPVRVPGRSPVPLPGPGRQRAGRLGVRPE